MAPTHVTHPTRIEAAGNVTKLIDEYVGHVNTGTGAASIARMSSPAGWEEPGQTPDFEEVTLVLSGRVHVEYRDGHLDVGPGEAVITHPGEWARYSTPDGADYVSVCIPAFSPATVHRD